MTTRIVLTTALISSLIASPFLALAEDETSPIVEPVSTTISEPADVESSGGQKPPVRPLMQKRDVPPPKQLRATATVTPRVLLASTTKPVPPNVRNMMEKRDALEDRANASGTRPLQGELRDRAKEAREKANTQRFEQMKQFASKTIERMRLAIERLTKLADRIDSRIVKIETNGGETTKAKNAMTRARAELEKAKTAVSAAEVALQNALPATTTPESMSGTSTRPQPGLGQNSPIRDPLKKAEQAVRAAQKSLTDALSALKGDRGTTTPALQGELPPPPQTGTATPTM